MVAPAAERAGVWSLRDSVLGAPTTFVVTAMSEADAMAAVSAARAEIDRLESIFNGRRLGSELVALNAAGKMDKKALKQQFWGNQARMVH